MADEKELRTADSLLPVDVSPVAPLAPITAPSMKPKRLDAYQFGDSYGQTISFGMNRPDTAKFLRELADRIESGEYLLQEGSVLSHAERDDYPMTYVTLKFHQKKTEA